MRVLRHALPGRVDPAAAYRLLHGDDTDTFWLDSGPAGISYLGAGERWEPSSPVLPAVRTELAAARAGTRLGLVGWFGYELRGETMGDVVARPSLHPDAAFLRVTRALAIAPDGTAELIARGEAWTGALAAWRDATVARLAQPPPPSAAVAAGASALWHDDESGYLAKIATAQASIRAGDAYLLNLTTEVTVTGAFDPVAVFEALRADSPSHHGALVRIGGVSLVSSSPESFLEVGAGGIVTTSPVKGTQPRSTDAVIDGEFADELRTNEKERAENVMIVDLMRNDLGRICVPGSVTVPRLLDVESYPRVHQLVSVVRGRLRSGLDAVDAIGACLPAGSMTGAPKLSATRILDELEQRPRGLYAGAFGYLGFDGSADLAMTIRSIVIDAAGATVGVGGGITALSEPEAEYAEVRLKAAAMLAALGA